MEINQENLENARVGFETIYDSEYTARENTYQTVAMRTNSTNAGTVYKGFKLNKRLTKWLGERQIKKLAAYKFYLENEPFEDTVAVDRDDFEDDNLGAYEHQFKDLGQAAKEWPDDLVWDLLPKGFNVECYDGQNFFDTDHPVLDENENEISVSNFMGGAGTPWYLIDDSRSLMPIIFQERTAPRFASMTDASNPHVFLNKEYVYGVDSRGTVGFALWQLALASKQTLNSANFNAAYSHMMSMKGDYGRQLAIMPKKLVVPPSLREVALEITQAERNANGATNINRNVVEVHIEPRLAA